jgi:stage II sporulation protein D
MKNLSRISILIILVLATGCNRLEYVDKHLGYDDLRKPLIRVCVFVGDGNIVLGAEASYVVRAWPDSGGQEIYYSASPLKIKSEHGLLSLLDTYGNLLERSIRKATLTPQKSQGPLLINGKRFRGILELYPQMDGTYYVVNVLNIEDYLRGVLPPEIGKLRENEFEAFKAQAVAARTYALATRDKYPDKHYDLINDIRDQVYTGIDGETDATNKAIDQTRGQAITYNGELIQAYYHSTCAGSTDNIEEVWDRDPLPYLRSVTDDDFCKWSKFYDWNELFTVREFLDHIRTYLSERGSGAERVGSKLIDLQIVDHTPAGRVKSVQLETDKGTVMLYKDQIRWAFGRSDSPGIMKSTNFVVDLDRGPDDSVQKVRITGYGYGHGVGMCQCGAIGMARVGYGYRDILTHYYAGVKIEKLY